MSKLRLSCVLALLLIARAAGAISIEPGEYLRMIENARAYGHVPLTAYLHTAADDAGNRASQDALLAELGDDVLPVGQSRSFYAVFGAYVNYVRVYANEAGVRKLLRSRYVEQLMTDSFHEPAATVQSGLYQAVACAGSLEIEATLKLENLVMALDAQGDTVLSSSPALDEELRREVPAFLATLPPEGGTWLDAPTLGPDGLPRYPSRLRFQVNRLGLVALMYHAKTAWLGQPDRPREPLYVDPELLDQAERSDVVPVSIQLRWPDYYSYSMPEAARRQFYALLEAATAEVAATLGPNEGTVHMATGWIDATLSPERLRALLANPDPRIASITPPPVAVAFTAAGDSRPATLRAAATAASCPPPNDGYPASGTRLCLRETERNGGLAATTLLHRLSIPAEDRYRPGSVFVGATDSAQPGRLWLMDGLGVWHDHESGTRPPVFARRLATLTGMHLLAAPADLSAFAGRLTFWAGYGKSAASYDPADHFAEMLAADRYHEVWTAGTDDDSRGEVCATVE